MILFPSKCILMKDWMYVAGYYRYSIPNTITMTAPYKDM
jgi:hypothetical protein